MIPTFNCASYLRETLASVLRQDPGPAAMQIEVVDDCSTRDDPEAVVRELGAGRVTFHRKPANAGAVANFNTCLERSVGRYVHVLHGDDYVQPNFYATYSRVIDEQPKIALFASRSFYVDEQGIVLGVSERLPELERGGNDVTSFLYTTPIQCPSVVIKRSFYEEHGGFLPALVHTTDCEMWSRAVALGGGVVLPDVLANYRVFAANDSGRLMRTAANLHDIERLNVLFSKRHPAFDAKRGRQRICKLALRQGERFRGAGDAEAAEANLSYFRKHAPPGHKLEHFARRLARAARRMAG